MSIPRDILDRCGQIPGWMNDDCLNWLYERASEAQVVVEIGVWKARSTVALCEGCPGTVYAVDYFQGNPEELEHEHAECQTADGRRGVMWAAICNLQPYMESGKCILLPMKSEVASQLFDYATTGYVDFAFIDGAHDCDSVTSDIITWKGALRLRGIIAGHDYDRESVARAVYNTLGEVEVFKGDGQHIWWKRL